ncbi:MAG: TonB-dependent receptor [Dysgonamonadaceae bacterium]|jgi:TonB-linked SusC/RagA family outer membrane protein|nr:TonB-dependent receptor [Dysgonamonadaceae bacterium]
MEGKLKDLAEKRFYLWRGWRSVFLLCAVFLCASVSAFAQGGITLRGRVVDTQGEGVPGALINIVGSTRGSATDETGNFEMTNIANGAKLLVTSLGMADKQVTFTGQNDIIVVLAEKADELAEVVISGFGGRQKKESVVSAIQSVNVSELRVPSSNLTTAFSGRIAGMISYQTSGEPGADSNATFFIRGVTSFGTGKVDPLILVDNIEITKDELAKLHPDDLQSFSILKDATATALYGARGANGVILVTTKEGREGKARVSFRLENAVSMPTQTIEMADAITYMQMANEAKNTRSNRISMEYPRSDITETQLGKYPLAYPNVDWMNLLIKDYTLNQRANLSISGGGKVARYYVSGSFANDGGLMNVDHRQNFNTNVNYKKYTLHSNINVNLTSSTEMILRLHGGFDDYVGPLDGGSDIYKKTLQVSPVRFLPYYQPDAQRSSVDWILFGNSSAYSLPFVNPYADLMKGYKNYSNSSLMAQLEFKQDFSALLKGLGGRVLGNTARKSFFEVKRSYEPMFYEMSYFDRVAYDAGIGQGLTPGQDFFPWYLYEINPTANKYLGNPAVDQSITNIMYGEAALSYDNGFDKNNVSAMLVGTVRNYTAPNADLIKSLPERNLGLAGRFTYNFDTRYFVEFNFGYNGSEKFDKDHRWGFFPSFGGGYLISNEKYWTSLKDKINLLKLKYTYGSAGNDQISNQRFFYISEIQMGNPGDDNIGGKGFKEGEGFGVLGNGSFSNMEGPKIIHEMNKNITWEIAYKHNLGLELGVLNKINIQADIYKEHRVNILQERADIPVTIGLWSIPLANVGETKTVGGEIALDYNHSFSKDIWLTARATFTYAHSEYAYYEEPDYSAVDSPWRSKVGRATTQQEGYIAERLFIDEADIANSPTQADVMPGDIKYLDLNDDGVINELDKRGIGYPTTPEMNYGFGFSFGYKSFDISAFFQGAGRSSFFVDPEKVMPFLMTKVDNDTRYVENGLAKFIADDYWSEINNNPFARWPRLADTKERFANNLTKSTYWMYDNNYLRFKSFELGYSLSDKLVKKMRLGSLRFYVSGTNLWLWSSFKIWDIELGDNGLNYPLQRTINAGVNLMF